MKVSCTYAARMMLVLLCACLTWGASTTYAQDDCCDRILDLTVTQAAIDQCCFTVSGKIDIDSRCFRAWTIQEYVNGSWVSVSPTLVFNRDGSFSYTICGEYGTHTLMVLFLDYDGNVRCRKKLEYTCREESDCCDLIRGPYIEQFYVSEDKCCYKIYGTVGPEGVEKCFRYWELQTQKDGQWVGIGSFGFAEDGGFGIEHCVETGVHEMRIVFYGHNGEVLCIRNFTLNCEHPCCELIKGPFIYPDESGRECCFTIKGSVGIRGLECFRYWDFEIYKDGQWVHDGSFGFDSDGTFSIYKCMEFGTHRMRIVFYDMNGRPICIKELEYTCEHPCCDAIRGPFITPSPIGTHDLCCFRLFGSVGDFGLNCFKWWEFEIYKDGQWVNDGVKYPFDGAGGFEIVKCLPPGTYQIRILFSDGSNIICVRETKYTCENDCCRTIDGPYINPAPIDPRPGYCCFNISGKVGADNRCFKFIQLEFLVDGVWVNDGSTYTFNPDGSFSITRCVRAGTHQIRVLFYSPNKEVICTKELTYTCEDRCCETIQGPFIYPAAIDPRPGVCCFTIKGSVGENNPCFKYWEFEYFINGQWVNDGGQYGFNPDGSFTVTKCVPPGTYPILVKFYDSNRRLICVKRLEYDCGHDCCDFIRGPFVSPSPIDPPPGRCCFTVSGKVEAGSDCFAGWQYEELINGVWVNDLTTYPFNPDGSFSITKCRPYGTHLIRILFIGPNDEVICKKKLEYTCEGDCCESIDGPYIYPATDVDPDRCCFTIKGSVGENNPCFKYWEYLEFINGQWVNDGVQYGFNPDGSFSITKCRPFGSHQVVILFYDQNGQAICKRLVEYSCEPRCCNTIEGPYIYPAQIDAAEAEDDLARRCCFTIKGSVGECNPCFRYWEYEELINGVWVNDGVSYTFNADGSFSITKCRRYGTHHVRILFYDYSGNVICVRELTYTCRPDPRCCETIQGPFIRTILSTPEKCCFVISGTIGPDNPCFASFDIEEFIDGVWVPDRRSYTFNDDGSFVVEKCVRPGSHLFRILFRSEDGRVRCIREFKYECENRCCETIQGPYIETYHTSPEKCCFRIFGSVGRRNECFRSFELERFIRGQWVNDGVSYTFDADGNYELRKCVRPGTHLMRLVFRDFNGEPICIREFTYTCDYDNCCEMIRGPEVRPLPSPSAFECCFLIYGSVSADSRCFSSYEFEELIDGVWVNDRVSYTFNPDGTFELRKCLPAGLHIMRLIFRDVTGAIRCVKEFQYSCEHPCCKTISGPYIERDDNSRECCFKVYGKVDPNCFKSFEFEILLDGRWVNDGVSYTFNADGSFSIYKCLRRGVIYTMRLLFRDSRTGKVICIREFSYGCAEAAEGSGSEALKGAARSVSEGVVQNLASVPNPASDQMTVSYELTEETPVRLSLFSHIGQEVLLLDQGVRAAGKQSLPVSISNLASGVYFVRLVVNGTAVDLPVTIVK